MLLLEYREEVFRFVDKIEAFYKNSLPKKIPEDEFEKMDISHFGMSGTDVEMRDFYQDPFFLKRADCKLINEDNSLTYIKNGGLHHGSGRSGNI